MPDLEVLPEDPARTDAAGDDRNGRIAALLLVALVVVAFAAMAAGQAFASQGGCGGPGHGEALFTVRSAADQTRRG
jgi:hypothetical protein